MNDKALNSFENISASIAHDDGLRRKSIRGAFFMALAGAFEFGARVGGMLVLARILRPEDFGLVAMVTALTGIVEIFKDLGLGVATVQRETITNQETSALFWLNAFFGGFVTLVFLIMSPAISWFYGDDRLSAVTSVVAITLLFGGMAIQHEAILNRQIKQGVIAFIRLLATTVSLALGIGLAWSDFGYWALVVREVSRSLIFLLGVWYYSEWIPIFVFKVNAVKDYLRFGRDLTLTNILMAIVGKIDSVLIGKFFGPSVLGIYQQAFNLIIVPIQQLDAPVFNVAQPGLSALQSDPVRYRRYFQRIATYVSMVTMPLGIFAAVYPEEITLLVLGAKWLPASEFLRVFAIAAALLPTLATSTIVLVTLGRSGVLLKLAFSQSIVLVIMMIAGLQWGAMGIALAHVTTSVLFIAPRLYYGFKRSPVNVEVFLSAIRFSIVSSAFMGIFLLMFRFVFPIGDSVTRLLVGCGVALIVYLLPRVLVPAGRAELWSILHDIQSSFLWRNVQTPINLAREN